MAQSGILKGAAIRRGWTRYGLAPMVLVAALVVVLGAADHGGKISRYLIVSSDSSMSGSSNSADEPRISHLRDKYGSRFAWFRQDGRDYVVNDSRFMDQLDEAMAPQREVNQEQDEVNRRQDEVNRLQDQVSRQQDEVNRAQDVVNRQQDLVNEGSASQSRVNELQAKVNERQQAVNAEQAKVNQRQAQVNSEQNKVNQIQARATAEIQKALQTLFDSARRQGLAHAAEPGA